MELLLLGRREYSRWAGRKSEALAPGRLVFVQWAFGRLACAAKAACAGRTACASHRL